MNFPTHTKAKVKEVSIERARRNMRAAIAPSFALFAALLMLVIFLWFGLRLCIALYFGTLAWSVTFLLTSPLSETERVAPALQE